MRATIIIAGVVCLILALAGLAQQFGA